MAAQLAPIWLIFKRELRDQLRDWRILVPMFLLTAAFPFLVREGSVLVTDFTAKYGGGLIGERITPFFMLITGFLPITISLVMSLEAFVGEKERGTIEPLLSTPLKDWQLYLGKLLSGTVLPLVAGYGAIGMYLYLIFRSGLKIPPADILIQTLVLTAVQAFLMVAAAITVSMQSTSVRAANLLASFIIIPVAILIQGETMLMFWGTNQVLWLAVLVVVVLAGLLVRLGLSHFQREYLLGREIDVLNLRWIGRTFWSAFSGGRRSVPAWYAGVLWPTLWRLRLSLLLVLVLGSAGTAAGYFGADRYLSEFLSALTPEKMPAAIQELQSTIGMEMTGLDISVSYILGHNLSAIFFIMLAGLFSFSVLGLLLYVMNTGLIGVALALAPFIGFSPASLLLTGILPHGIFEIPAVIISTAAVLQMGAVLVTPTTLKTMGEVMLECLADWLKVTLGLVLPLLLLAAVIETYVTPALLLSSMR